LEQFAVAGAGTGKIPWAIFAVPPPTFKAEQANFSMPECVEPDAGTDDVHDRVHGAHFVEMIFSSGTSWTRANVRSRSAEFSSKLEKPSARPRRAA